MTHTFNSKKYGVITVNYVRSNRNYYFTVTTGQSLTREEQKIIQEHLGYHPCGYSYYYISGDKWSCWNSCD